ncbi:hypothetical protein GCM10027612_34100 [Microbispora bryophytorum subsp. camponoti]
MKVRSSEQASPARTRTVQGSEVSTQTVAADASTWRSNGPSTSSGTRPVYCKKTAKRDLSPSVPRRSPFVHGLYAGTAKSRPSISVLAYIAITRRTV